MSSTINIRRQAKLVCDAIHAEQPAMASSADLCVADALHLSETGHADYAAQRMEKAAQYVWGFARPAGW